MRWRKLLRSCLLILVLPGPFPYFLVGSASSALGIEMAPRGVWGPLPEVLYVLAVGSLFAPTAGCLLMIALGQRFAAVPVAMVASGVALGLYVDAHHEDWYFLFGRDGHWFVANVLGLVAWGFAVAMAALTLNGRQAERSRGDRSACGYDLTGNVSGVCPECGKERQAHGSRADP